MGQQVVTELVIDSDTSGGDRFSSSMDKAEGSAKSATSSVAGMTLAIAGVGVAVIGAIAGLRSFIDYVGNQTQALVDMDEHAKLAGFSMKEFQETLFAARAKGLTEKDFVGGLDRIAADLTAAGRGVTEFGRLFEANGLSIKNSNGELKNTKAALADISGLMQNASPQVQQAITKIVGLSASWVPFLRQGVEGIEAQKKAAADLGVVIDDDMIRKAGEFNAQWKTAIATWDLQFKASLTSILPLLIQLANIASTVIEGVGSLTSTLSRHMTPDDEKSKSQLNDQINQVAQLREMMASLNDQSGEFKKFKVTNLAELVGLPTDASLKDVDALLDKLSALYDKRPTAITVGAVGSTVLPPANDNKDALDRETERLEKHIAVTKADIEAVGQSEAARAGLRAEATLYAAAERAGFTDLEQFADKFMKIREQVEATTAALMKAKAEGDAKFNFQTLGLSDTEKQIATIQRQLHGDDWKNWMNDGLSSTIRLTDNLKLVSDSLKDIGKAAFSAALQGKLGMDGLVSTLDAVAKKLADKSFENLLSGNPDQMVTGAIQAGASAVISLFTGDVKAKQELAKAQAAWHDMAGQVANFNLAAKGFNLGPLTTELQSLFSTVETLQKAAQAAHDKSGEAQAAGMFNSAVDRIFKQFKDGSQVLTPLQQQMKAVNDEAEGLKETLLQISPGFSGLANQIDSIKQQQIDDVVAKFHDTFITGLTTRLNSAKGQGLLNDTANLLLQHAQDLASVSDLGNDPTLLGQVATTFKAEAQKIVDDAALVGTAFTDFTTQFPMLKDVVHEFTQSAVDDSKALRDAQNSAAKNITDYLNNLISGPGATSSPTATLSSAQSVYNSNLGLAIGGNVDAQSKFPQLADNLEKAARAVFASGQGYQDIKSQIISQGLALPAVQNTTDPLVQAMRDTIAAINAAAQTQALDATLQGVIKTAIDAGNAAQIAALLVPKFDTLNTTSGAGLNFNQFVTGLGPSYAALATDTKVGSLLTDTQLRAAGINVSGPLTSAQIAALGLSLEQGNVLNVFRELDGNGNGIIEKSEAIRVAAGNAALNTLNTRGSVDALGNPLALTQTNTANTRGSVDAGNTVLGAIKLLQGTATDQLVLLQNALTPTASANFSVSGGSGQTAANKMVDALNKIVVNTYMISLNTNAVRPAGVGTGGIGIFAQGGWITGGIPGRDSVPLASGNALGMPGEFVVRHDIAQMNRSWLPDFNATGRLPFNDNRPFNVAAPAFRGSAGNSNAELVAEVRALRKEVEQLRKENNGGNVAIANQVTRAIRDTSDDQIEATEESSKRTAYAITTAAKEQAA